MVEPLATAPQRRPNKALNEAIAELVDWHGAEGAVSEVVRELAAITETDGASARWLVDEVKRSLAQMFRDCDFGDGGEE